MSLPGPNDSATARAAVHKDHSAVRVVTPTPCG
jgi:hypothetical protein